MSMANSSSLTRRLQVQRAFAERRCIMKDKCSGSDSIPYTTLNNTVTPNSQAEIARSRKFIISGPHE